MQWEYFGGAAPAPFNSQLSSPLSSPSSRALPTWTQRAQNAPPFPDACCVGLGGCAQWGSSGPALLSRHVAGMTVSSGLEPPMLVARDRGVLANTDALQWLE